MAWSVMMTSSQCLFFGTQQPSATAASCGCRHHVQHLAGTSRQQCVCLYTCCLQARCLLRCTVLMETASFNSCSRLSGCQHTRRCGAACRSCTSVLQAHVGVCAAGQGQLHAAGHSISITVVLAGWCMCRISRYKGSCMLQAQQRQHESENATAHAAEHSTQYGSTYKPSSAVAAGWAAFAACSVLGCAVPQWQQQRRASAAVTYVSCNLPSASRAEAYVGAALHSGINCSISTPTSMGAHARRRH
jgi:hypothetical protein